MYTPLPMYFMTKVIKCINLVYITNSIVFAVLSNNVICTSGMVAMNQHERHLASKVFLLSKLKSSSHYTKALD